MDREPGTRISALNCELKESKMSGLSLKKEAREAQRKAKQERKQQRKLERRKVAPEAIIEPRHNGVDLAVADSGKRTAGD